jgi:predicted secreted acid phosphatase
MYDQYFDMLQQWWDTILFVYKKHEDKKPVILLDIQEELIYAYPYAEFKADMSKKSQIKLEQQYKDAISKNMIIVFVRDNENEKLVSYTMECT